MPVGLVDLEKLFFRYIIFLYLETVLQGVTKYRPAEKQVDTEIQATLKHAPARKLTEGKITERLYLFILLRRDYSFSSFVLLFQQILLAQSQQ